MVFTLTIISLGIVVGFIFFIICYMKMKRKKAAISEVDKNDCDNLDGKLVRNTTDMQN